LRSTARLLGRWRVFGELEFWFALVKVATIVALILAASP